ncbi:MAG: hypothetical protein HC919_01405 [Oscillatoriales cyanobacterium SM2_2_1]|nr:hypothetical protein [Oscillatoriales cyanobacterium SM2_2_1]
MNFFYLPELMQNQQSTLIAVALIASFLAWQVRGLYDGLGVGHNLFHVVNTTKVNQAVVVSFPSGTSYQLSIPAESATEFMESKTGEGGIRLTSGAKTYQLGYVTSINPMIVIAISDTNATVTQVLPVKKTTP